MNWSRKAISVSAALSIIVGGLYVAGMVVSTVSGMIGGALVLIFVGAVIPLISGILVLRGWAPSLLLLAWGWVLGAHLSNALLSFLPRPSATPNEVGWAFTFHDYSDGFMVCVALVGLVLYFVGSHRVQKEN